MSNLPNAEQSPRIVNGVLKWYEGDTFDLDLLLDLEDQDGTPVTIGPGDTVTVTFRNRRLEQVKEFSFTDIQRNMVTMDFDTACTALFPKGIYTYDVQYSGVERTTFARDNRAVVE